MFDQDPLPNSPFAEACGICKTAALCRKKAKCLYSAANTFSEDFRETLVELTEKLEFARNRNHRSARKRLGNKPEAPGGIPEKKSNRRRLIHNPATEAKRAVHGKIRVGDGDVKREPMFQDLPTGAANRVVRETMRRRNIGQKEALEYLKRKTLGQISEGVFTKGAKSQSSKTSTKNIYR